MQKHMDMDDNMLKDDTMADDAVDEELNETKKIKDVDDTVVSLDELVDEELDADEDSFDDVDLL